MRDQIIIKMEKLKSLLSTLTQIQVDVRRSGAQVNPLLSYLLLALGTVQLAKIIKQAATYILFVHVRRLFHAVFKTYQPLIPKERNQILLNSTRWAIIYGATNHIGQTAAKVLAKHGYSLILVDSSLDKLQKT